MENSPCLPLQLPPAAVQMGSVLFWGLLLYSAEALDWWLQQVR